MHSTVISIFNSDWNTAIKALPAILLSRSECRSNRNHGARPLFILQRHRIRCRMGFERGVLQDHEVALPRVLARTEGRRAQEAYLLKMWGAVEASKLLE